MIYKRLTSPYWSFAASITPQAAQKAFETWADKQSWWLTLPFGWITVVFLAIGFGALIEDLSNPNSAIRHSWREWRKIFNVVVVHATHESNNSFERIDLVCRIKFTKAVDNATLTIRVVTPTVSKIFTHIAYQEELNKIPADFEKQLRFGNIAITRPGQPARHSIWGDRLGSENIEATQKPMIGGTISTVEISINHQTYRIYAHVLDPSREESGRIFLLSQDNLLNLTTSPSKPHMRI
jgi:hypothetical protein